MACENLKDWTRRTDSNKKLYNEAFNIARNLKYDGYQRVLHSTFIENIWGAGFADMQLISKFNEGFRFLLCVTNTFSKYYQ